MQNNDAGESCGDNHFPTDQDMQQPDSGQPFFLKKIALQRKQMTSENEDMGGLPQGSSSIDKALDPSAEPLDGKAIGDEQLQSPNDHPMVHRVKSMKEVGAGNEALSPAPLVK